MCVANTSVDDDMVEWPTYEWRFVIFVIHLGTSLYISFLGYLKIANDIKCRNNKNEPKLIRVGHAHYTYGFVMVLFARYVIYHRTIHYLTF